MISHPSTYNDFSASRSMCAELLRMALGVWRCLEERTLHFMRSLYE